MTVDLAFCVFLTLLVLWFLVELLIMLNRRAGRLRKVAAIRQCRHGAPVLHRNGEWVVIKALGKYHAVHPRGRIADGPYRDLARAVFQCDLMAALSASSKRSVENK